jgi:hypothetical protein
MEIDFLAIKSKELATHTHACHLWKTAAVQVGDGGRGRGGGGWHLQAESATAVVMPRFSLDWPPPIVYDDKSSINWMFFNLHASP